MLAGAGKEEIALKEECLKTEDYAVIHRALDVRTLVLKATEEFAFVSVEVTSLPVEVTQTIREKTAEVTGIDCSHIWVSCTHTFSAPHILPDFMLKDEAEIRGREEYRTAIQNAAVISARKAMEQMTPVIPRFGSAYCSINAARDVELEEGWWVGEDSKGLVDHEVEVLCLDNQKGKPQAVLFNYAVQSSVLDGSELSAGGKAVSPDIAGTACAYVENEYADQHMIAMFMVGAAGDQIPVSRAVTETFSAEKPARFDRHEEGFRICEKLGKELGTAVCKAIENAAEIPTGGIKSQSVSITVPAKKMEHDRRKIRPVKQFTYQENGETVENIEAFVLGDLAVIGIRPELNCVTAQSIKVASPYKETMIATMVNGASKYMADKRSYERFTYEAQNSPFGKGAAEIVARESISLLEHMYAEGDNKQREGKSNYTDRRLRPESCSSADSDR